MPILCQNKARGKKSRVFTKSSTTILCQFYASFMPPFMPPFMPVLCQFYAKFYAKIVASKNFKYGRSFMPFFSSGFMPFLCHFYATFMPLLCHFYATFIKVLCQRISSVRSPVNKVRGAWATQFFTLYCYFVMRKEISIELDKEMQKYDNSKKMSDGKNSEEVKSQKARNEEMLSRAIHMNSKTAM